MTRRCSIPISLVLICAALFTVGGTPSRASASSAAAYGPKRITLSLSRQRLRAWEGRHLVLVTPITTGNASLPTPVGHFTIFMKRSPYTFISPWPKGSRDWYPPSQSNFVLEFLQGGYFIHDAPWRGVYGRGSNTGTQPGTNYGGTHGCVNVPYNAARFLYYWAPLGTPVHIVP